MNTKTAAKLCGVHITTIAKMCKEGVLKADRIRNRGPHGAFDIKESSDDLVRIVRHNLGKPVHERANGAAPAREVRHSLLAWAALPSDRRNAALELARIATTDDLKAMITLLKE